MNAVYIGKRRGADVPLIHVWRYLDESGSLTDKSVAVGCDRKQKTKITGSWIGEVYDVVEEDDKVRANGSKIKQWEDIAQLQEWRLEERGAEASVQFEKKMKAAGFGDTTLDEAKTTYRKTIGSTARTAILAAVIQHITR